MSTENLELRSCITSAGQLELSLVASALAPLQPDEVRVRVEATPINPSDLALLLGPADLATAAVGGTPERPIFTATVPAERLPTVAARLDQALPVGIEGAGVVVEAGEAARALVGKTVAVAGGGMFARYHVARAHACLVLPAGTTPAQGAAAYVNPMTVLAMLETMRREGHTALVHTAAASNLGQMLVRACAQDAVPLINIVRSAEQVAILRALGATHVLDSTTPSFRADLVEAIATTGATLGFDAIGGGPLAGQILGAMEVAASRRATRYDRYGTSVHKQVYIYGRLDLRPTALDASAGFAWGVGGWLLNHALARSTPEVIGGLRARVLAELTTTFASHFAATLSLAEALQPDAVRMYGRRATGAKYLIDPSR
ncbi:MAG: zinc-binding dehydrogenase [Proteobacteria bacterium]|nr:zinc-binding dehydrogenase [Pseudomonadota bacterium]